MPVLGVLSFLGLCCRSFRCGWRGSQGGGAVKGRDKPRPAFLLSLWAPLCCPASNPSLVTKDRVCSATLIGRSRTSEPQPQKWVFVQPQDSARSASWPLAVEWGRWGRWCDPMGWGVGPPGRGCREWQTGNATDV